MTKETTSILNAPAAEPVPVTTTQPDVPADPYAAVTLPENSLVPEETWSVFKQTARELNLPAQALEKWLSLEEARLQTAVQHQAQHKQEERDAWARRTREMLGPRWQEEVSKAVRAADVFGGPELRQLLEETGLGNHPVIVRTFTGIGKRMSEDISLAGTLEVTADKTFTQALYGKN